MHANKGNSNGVHFEGCIFFFNMIICKSKFTLAFKKEGTFKVAVKQHEVVVHATANATFALSGQENLLDSTRE